jgi:sugar phosphate isomerase/epimerase
LQTAIKLNAPSIRVWAGKYGSNDADENYWHSVISDSKRIASMAADHGISINFEYHGGTLTDTKESARKLMKEVKHPNVGLYWQPAVGKSMEARIESIKEIQRWLTHVHVFHWEGTKRLPLFDGEQDWIRYLRTIGEPAENRYLMLEFVKDDHKVQFLEDAGILKSIIETASA